jgi:hypothetical protein
VRLPLTEGNSIEAVARIFGANAEELFRRCLNHLALVLCPGAEFRFKAHAGPTGQMAVMAPSGIPPRIRGGMLSTASWLTRLRRGRANGAVDFSRLVTRPACDANMRFLFFPLLPTGAIAWRRWSNTAALSSSGGDSAMTPRGWPHCGGVAQFVTGHGPSSDYRHPWLQSQQSARRACIGAKGENMNFERHRN